MMSTEAELSKDGRSVAVHVALAFKRRGGRKRVVVPEGRAAWAPKPQPPTTLVKALARAHRWQKLLEGGAFGSIEELAAAERINSSYVARVLRLALLSPASVEAILDAPGARERIRIDVLMRPFPADWDEQSRLLASGRSPSSRK